MKEEIKKSTIQFITISSIIVGFLVGLSLLAKLSYTLFILLFNDNGSQVLTLTFTMGVFFAFVISFKPIIENIVKGKNNAKNHR